MNISLKEFINLVGEEKILRGQYIKVVDNGEATIKDMCKVNLKTREVILDDWGNDMVELFGGKKEKEYVELYKMSPDKKIVDFVRFDVIKKSKMKQNDFVLWRKE